MFATGGDWRFFVASGDANRCPSWAPAPKKTASAGLAIWSNMRAVLLAGLLAVAALVHGQTPQPYTDVPFVATSDNIVDAMLDIAGVKSTDVLVDLGSGDGRIPLAAAKRFGAHAIGIEIDPELVQRSRELARQEGVSDKVTFIQADLFQYDLSQATVVTMFLTPGVNLRLKPKLLRELKTGSRIVCHRFDLGSWIPTKTLTFQEDHVYLYVVPSGAPETAAPASAQAPPSRERLEAMFAYDSSAALNDHSEESTEADGALVTQMSYSGVRGPVSATLVTPIRAGKNPAVIFAADYGKKDEFLSEAILLAKAALPVVSLLIDSPAERPVGWRHNFSSLIGNDNDRDIHIEAVGDIRRGIDLLSVRTNVDASRIAYVGHGYGANWGAILGSIDKRLRVFVLIAAFPSLGEVVSSDDPDAANMRYALGSKRFALYRASISAVDPILYTRYWKQAPVLFQFGRFDEFATREMADRLVTSIPGSKAIFYDSGHSVNAPSAICDRSKFLARHIGSGLIDCGTQR